LEKPPPRASAIIPDPINPTFVFGLLIVFSLSTYSSLMLLLLLLLLCVVVCWFSRKKFSL
jgi:hypothetical protein